MNNKRWIVLTAILLAALAVGVLSGCGSKAETPVAEPATGDGPTAGGFAGIGLDPTNELALGTLKLEGTGNAVTPAQAAEMLPLWQAVASGSLKGEAETEAVIKQIEAKLTDAQREAIGGLELTGQDIGARMQEQGIEMQGRPGGGQGGQGGQGAFQNMTDEERAKMREEFQNMSPEQRLTRMAEMGIQRPEGGAPGGGPGGGAGRTGGRGAFLVEPLIELLTERAAE